MPQGVEHTENQPSPPSSATSETIFDAARRGALLIPDFKILPLPSETIFDAARRGAQKDEIYEVNPLHLGNYLGCRKALSV